MRKYVVAARDAVRTQLWPIPTVAVLLAGVLGLLVPELDRSVDRHLWSWADTGLFDGDAGAARSLLDAISTSLMTVTSLTFSLTVVTLQLASSQFSPRLLRTFTRDLFVQVTLGLFLATFVYSLSLLRSVRDTGAGGAGLVPRIGVSLAFVLAVASVVGLVLFLAHLTRQIRVETMLANVHADAVEIIGTVLPAYEGAARAVPAAPVDCSVLVAQDEGFLTWVAERALVDAARELDAVVELDVVPGRYLVRGTSLGRAWRPSADSLDADTTSRLQAAVTKALHTGSERTAAQDVGYGLRQLVDVANKALSPGINDPTTAVHALGHISAVLCRLSGRDLGPLLLEDGDRTLRVVGRRPDLAGYVDLGLGQPRRYGAGDPQVLAAVGQTLLDLAETVRPDQQEVVLDQLTRLQATVAEQGRAFDDADRASLAELTTHVRRVVSRRSGAAPG